MKPRAWLTCDLLGRWNDKPCLYDENTALKRGDPPRCIRHGALLFSDTTLNGLDRPERPRSFASGTNPMTAKPYIEPRLRALLEQSGQPWQMVFGGKHRKLFVGGRMVGVLPHSRRTSARDDNNIIAEVRRYLRNI